MKVAILHDYLNQLGGAERVTQALLEIYPEADIYTLFYDKEKLKGLFSSNIKKTSFLDIQLVKNHHRFFIPLMPLASSLLKSKENYDLIISGTAGYAKGFNIKGKFHICYCHTPLRYAWEKDYLKNLPSAPQFLIRTIGNLFAFFLKKWDKKASRKVDCFIANSDFIAEKINKYYGRSSEVIYPPVDNSLFYFKENKTSKEDYYLMVGRLLYYKKFDIGIKAFSVMKKNLKIIGKGPELTQLKKMTNKRYVEFIENVDDKELNDSYNNARGLIFPQVEDFGLVAAEAGMCGLPIIAYDKGGAIEIVEDGKTGIFFNNQSPEAIIEAVNRFERIDFNRNYIANYAKRFSKETFNSRIKEVIEKNMAGF